MKKMIYFLLLLMTLATISTTASAQRRHSGDYRMQQSFYYYPQSNVYYSFTSGKYIYSYKHSWIVSERLPRYISLRREPRVVVTHAGFDVWNDNRYHVYQYGGGRREQPPVVYVPDDRYHDGRYNDNHKPY